MNLDKETEAAGGNAAAGKILAWATLAATLLVTLIAWNLLREDAAADARRRFDFRVAEIRFAVEARMQAQEQVLRGAGGFFAASNEVTRAEWQAYVAALHLERTYPGIQGIGFAQRIEPAQLAEHIQHMRAEGFPDYDIHPPGKRPEYTSIVFIEPFDWRNRRAFGYDMFTEATRRAAMAAARDSGRIHISGKVVLVQETGKDVQSGFLMYLPIYRHGAPHDTVEQRRLGLQGYVYSPFRMQDLMEGILGRRLPDVRLRIYDGSQIIDRELMYDSAGAPAGRPALFENSSQLEIENRQWTLLVTSLPEFEADAIRSQADLALAVGLLISALVFAVVWSLATMRERAAALATQMTLALRQSREQFKAVTETASDAIVSADAEGRIVYFNRAAERLFGYPADEAVGQPLAMLVPERLWRRIAEDFQRYMQSGAAPEDDGRTLDLLGRRKSGEEFPLEVSIAAWATARGRFFTAIARDISERQLAEARIHQLNAELRSQVEQLAATNRELESFSYTVSHDLRAPLRAVDGFAGMLAEDYGQRLDAEGLRLIGVIRTNSRRMGQLIDDLLSFSRLGRTSVAPSRVDMSALVQEVVEELRAGDENARQAEIVVGDLPAAKGDRALLRQVWINLLANALKFSRERQPPRVEIGGAEENGETRYFVRDNGVGFDMSHAGQLFGVFHRLHSDEDFPGTGVGLAIVHRIVEKHGGRIWAEGQIDQGATFRFSLPRGEGDA